MLRIPMILMMMASRGIGATEINFFDSKTNPKISWIMVNDCLVPIPKTKVQDACFVLKKVNKICGLRINLDECNE